MEGVAHSPKFAKKVGIPQSVGEDFATADERKHVAHALRKMHVGRKSW